MLNLSAWCAIVLADASLKAVLLVIVAAVLLWCFRVQDGNLRHRVWTSVLAGMLLLPFLSQMVPALRLPFLREVPLLNQDLWLAQRDDSVAVSSAVGEQKPKPLEHFQALSVTGIATPVSASLALGMASPSNQLTTGSMRDSGPAPATAALTKTLSDTPKLARSPSRSSGAGRWSLIVFGVWLTGFVAAASWLLLGMITFRLLRRRSTFVTPSELADIGLPSELAHLNGRPLRVLECPLIRVPLSAGLLRPSVLLPSDWLTWCPDKLRDVFAHERSHIERGDCVVVVLAEINRCLYWFHPIAWWLRTRLMSLAEEVCDDAAIGNSGSRTVYARHLLEVAGAVSVHRSRLVPMALSMARQSNVEERINAILDVARPVSKRLSRAASVVLIVAVVVTIGLAAALRPSLAGESESTTPPVANGAAMRRAGKEGMNGPTNHSIKGPAKGNAIGGENVSWPRKFAGRVTDSEGRPIEQARILLVSGSYSYTGESEPVGLRELARSDARGNFQFEITRQISEQDRLEDSRRAVQVIIQAPGYGLMSLPEDAFELQPLDARKREQMQRAIDEIYGPGRFADGTLKLRPEQLIQGRLVDLEGRPLANVMVASESISEPKIEKLLKAFEKSDKRLMYQAVTTLQIPLDPLQRLFPPSKTDASGVFTFRGVGQDQLITLTFHREGVEAERIYVLGRKMQPARLPQIEYYSNGYRDFYGGCEFSYALGPSAPVSGVVKDYDTGQPIPNSLVFVERLFGEYGRHLEQVRLACNYMRAMTDEQGRFRIVGIPPGDRHVLRAVPPVQKPYLMAEKQISPKLDGSDGKIEIRVKKGLWYEGRVTDKASGKPVRAYVDHLALRSNPYTLDKIGLRQGWQFERFPTDSDGRYRTLGLPGPGVLLVRAKELNDYPRAIGGDKVAGYDAKLKYIPTTPVGMPLVNWNLIIQVNPPKTATTFHRDVLLDAFERIPGRVAAPDGRPLSDVKIVGENNDYWWMPHTSADFQLKGYDGKGPRQLLFQASAGMLAGRYRLQGPAPKEILVKLEPAVRVKGRLTERESGSPIYMYCEGSTEGQVQVEPTTEDDGRFEIKGLLAGVVYKMVVDNSRPFVSKQIRFDIDLRRAKPGELIDLGDIGRTNSKKL